MKRSLLILLLLGLSACSEDREPQRTVVLGPGITITCPAENRPLYVLNQAIGSGDVLAASKFDPASPDVPPPVAGLLAACPRDGVFWMRNVARGYGMQIHTEAGWMPRGD